MGKIVAICTGEQKGEKKTPVETGVLCAGWGLEGDAHAGEGTRQVSMLTEGSVREFARGGLEVNPGDFGENLIVSGISFSELKVGDQLWIGSALGEITEIGKECIEPCTVFQRMGDCVMPREGVFMKVVLGGCISVGDKVEIAAIETKERKLDMEPLD